MSRLPALTPREVIRALERAGFYEARTSGGHCILTKPGHPTRDVVIPVHKRDLKRGTLHAIIKQAGLSVEEFLSFL